MMHNKLRGWLIALVGIFLIVSSGIYILREVGISRGAEGSKERVSPTLRVVSLVPSLTRCLYEMDAEKYLVGCTTYCKTAPEDSIPVVASAVKANLESVVALRPDLVLASTLIPPEDIQVLKNAGIRVEVFSSPRSYSEILEQFVHLGDLVHQGERAKAVADSVDHLVRSLPSSTEDPALYSAFMQVGADPIYAVIPHTFMSDYLEQTGCKNIFDDLATAVVTREAVVSRDPDVIFIVTMGLAAEEEADRWRSFTHMKACKHNRIYLLDAERACQPTPLNFLSTLEDIRHYLASSH